MTCCGKGLHDKFRDGVLASSEEQKGRCVMCRTKYSASGSKEDIEELRRWAEKGKAWAQCMLGCRYAAGAGVDQSYQQARELYELSARQGFAAAHYNLGLIYADGGQGVNQNYERAAEYWEAAARQGHNIAQFNLGALYYNGQGVELSDETARKWWMKAAEEGEESSIRELQVLDKQEGRTTPSFIPKPLECATCYRPHDPPEHRLNECAKCHRVYYCGRECQVECTCNKKTK